MGRADRRHLPLGRVRRAARRRRLRRGGGARLRHAGELPVRRCASGLGVAWQRALFAVPAHALFGATMGYYAGRAKFDQRRRRSGAIARSACSRPIVFHGLYDYALHHGLGRTIWVVISVLSRALWVFVLRRVHRAQNASPFRPAGDG